MSCRLATEVERLQLVAARVTECESQVEEYRRKLEDIEQASPQSTDEVAISSLVLKSDSYGLIGYCDLHQGISG